VKPLLTFLLISSGAVLAPWPLASRQGVSGKDVVAPSAYVSYDPAARGTPIEVAVVLKIRSGFHVNAHEVSFEYLIPTELHADVPAGFKASAVIYPKGTLETFAFAKNKQLNVYSDSVTVRLPLTVLLNAPLGEQHMAMKLHYQACSTEICLPPVSKDIDATLNIVAAPSAAKPANPSIFAR